MENQKPAAVIMGSYGALGQKTVFICLISSGIVVAQYDKEELKSLSAQLAKESKDGGGGKLSQIAASMKTFSVYQDMLSNMNAEGILSKNAENFFIDLKNIKEIKLKEKSVSSDDFTDEFYYLHIKTNESKYKFRVQISSSVKRIKQLLKELYSNVYK